MSKNNKEKDNKESEFEKWWLMEAQNIVGVGRATEKDVAKETWKAALRWVKYEGVISDYELAGKLIKDELED